VIITHVISGLGKQMFQYAAGSLASMRRALKAIGCFSIGKRVANEEDERQVLVWRAFGSLHRKLFHKRFVKFRGKHLFVDSLSNHRHQFVYMSDTCYLMRNWKSECYFTSVANNIRADFSFRVPVLERSAELAELMSQNIVISLHLRMGDIATNPASMAVHGLCSLGYYHRVIEYVSSKLAKPEFLIFFQTILLELEKMHTSTIHVITSITQGGGDLYQDAFDEPVSAPH
jgi:hypothetical protein